MRDVISPNTQIENKALIDLHLLVVFFALELQLVDILAKAHDLGLVKGCCIRISRKDVLADAEGWEVAASLWDGDEISGDGFVEILSPVFVRLRILDVVGNPVLCVSASKQVECERGQGDERLFVRPDFLDDALNALSLCH